MQHKCHTSGEIVYKKYFSSLKADNFKTVQVSEFRFIPLDSLKFFEYRKWHFNLDKSTIQDRETDKLTMLFFQRYQKNKKIKKIQEAQHGNSKLGFVFRRLELVITANFRSPRYRIKKLCSTNAIHRVRQFTKNIFRV